MEERNIEIDKQKIELKELRNGLKLNRKEFAEYFQIPLRTVEDWEAGKRKMPKYLLRLIMYKTKIDIAYNNGESERSSNNINVINEGNSI